MKAKPLRFALALLVQTPERCACQQRVGGHPRWLEDRAGHDVAFLAKNVDTFIEAARKRPKLASVSFRLM